MAKISTKLNISNKHIQIDKANTNILIATSVAVAIVMFTIVATQAMLKQLSYQNLVIAKRSAAANQLSKNVKAANSLYGQFQAWDNAQESLIGTNDKNSKIILDALPSKYDFPALATSLEGIIYGSGNKGSAGGADNEAVAVQDSSNPTTIEIPLSISANGTFTSAQKLIQDLERSIRPMKISQITLGGNDASMQLSVTLTTYYQPEKKLEYKQAVVTNTKATTKKAATPKTTKTGATN